MKIAFLIQSEGRGHTTQAIYTKHVLENNNIKPEVVIVGEKSDLLTNNFDNIRVIRSPKFFYSKKLNKISPWRTVSKNVFNVKKYINSIKELKSIFEEHKITHVFNFYDSLAGLYNIMYPSSDIKFTTIAHQYSIYSPGYELKYTPMFFFYLINNYISQIGSKKILALSEIERKSGHRKIDIVPPMLRKDIDKIPISKEDFFLCYFTHFELIDRLIEIASDFPDEKFVLYTNRKILETQENLILKEIDENGFIQDMARCKGLITSSGFEATTEAMYFQKPLYLIPTPGQIEQEINMINYEFLDIALGYENPFDHFIFMTERYEKPEFLDWLNSKEIIENKIKESLDLV